MTDPKRDRHLRFFFSLGHLDAEEIGPRPRLALHGREGLRGPAGAYAAREEHRWKAPDPGIVGEHADAPAKTRGE